MSPLHTAVRPHHGAPTLFINGQPDSGLMLYHNEVRVGHDEIADFARAGIHLLTTGLGSTAGLDPAAIDAQMRLILAANPQALVLPRVWLGPSAAWAAAHPEEMAQHYDPYLDQAVTSEYRCVSFASAAWRAEEDAALVALIRYCEEHYGEHLLGYHLCAGECGEWSYAWRHYTQSDYSAPQLAAWRQHLGDPTAEIPRDWRRPAGHPGTLDPAVPAERRLMQYLEFHSQVVADQLLQVAERTKTVLQQLGRTKIVAAFYGYHFTPPGNPSAFFNAGHHALARVLASPAVDVLCAPYTYFRREAGGTYYSQLVAGSARRHGKLVYSEDDTVTHVVPAVPYRYHCPDQWTTINVLRRNAFGALRDGGTSWYMDWFGQNWYRDAGLMADIAATQRLAQARLASDCSSQAQIAVLVDETAAFRLYHDGELINRWTLERLTDLWRLGAPIDVYLASDRAWVAAQPQYRLLITLDQPDARSVAELAAAALAAGVHRYSNAGDQIFAEREWLTVHAASTGPRTLALPAPATVTDAYTGALIATAAIAFTVTLRLGETAVYRLAPV